MDAKHVRGINVTGDKEPSILDSYFNKITLEPDETPSHTYVAAGNTEVPKRSDTVVGTIRRPSLSLRRSQSKLRRKSISHMSEVHNTAEPESKSNANIARTERVKTKEIARPLRMQSSLSRLRQRVGLDKELHEPAPISQAIATEHESAPRPIEKDYPPLQPRKPLSRAPSYASSKYSEPQRQNTSASIERKPSGFHQDPSLIQRRPPPASYEPAVVLPASTRPLRPKRVDSGTAIALDKVPAPARPLPFQEIMAVKNYAERMAMYKRTRDYWAYADHGLIEWTGRASGPKVAPYRTQRAV
jgi:hypothetical protein